MRRSLLRLCLIAAVVCVLLALAGCGSLRMVSGIRLQDAGVYETEVGEADLSTLRVCVSYTDGTEETMPISPDMIPASRLPS